MPISKKITTLGEEIDIDLQLMASELDTSVSRMKYLSDTLMEDAISKESFERLVEEIKTEGGEITSFNDNTVLYEFLDDAFVIHENLGVKYVLFDSSLTQKIEKHLDSYR